MLHILLIEDDQDDITFFEGALAKTDVPFSIDIIIRGDKVMPYLEKCTELPDVIVMDLNLPRVHGRDLLKKIKSIDCYKNIPIVILTTSTSTEDVEYCLQNGATNFITKPNSLDKYDLIIQSIIECGLKDNDQKSKTR